MIEYKKIVRQKYCDNIINSLNKFAQDGWIVDKISEDNEAYTVLLKREIPNKQTA